jgi:hypothetical protein
MGRFATRLSRTVVPANLTDPMSGFFMLRREVFTAANRRLSAIGFKLLLNFLPHRRARCDSWSCRTGFERAAPATASSIPQWCGTSVCCS